MLRSSKNAVALTYNRAYTHILYYFTDSMSIFKANE